MDKPTKPDEPFFHPLGLTRQEKVVAESLESQLPLPRRQELRSINEAYLFKGYRKAAQEVSDHG